MASRQKGFLELVEIIDQMPATLRMVRRMRGMSLREVADKSGVPLNVLSRLERGGNPSTVNLRALLIWLGGTP